MADTLKGKRALITGGTSGIGRAIALAFADKECRVTVTGHTVAEAKEFHRNHPGIDATALDLADDVAIRRLAAEWIGGVMDYWIIGVMKSERTH